MNNITIQIINIAKSKGISQKELARKAGVDPAVLSRMKKLESISLKNINKLLQAINYKIVLEPDNDYLSDLQSGNLL